MGRYSLVGDHKFFPPEQFPWVAELEANSSVIRKELDTVLARQDYVPNHQDISPDQKHLTNGRQLENIFLFRLRHRGTGKLPALPAHRGIVKKVPGAKTAFFSILAPHTHIPPHCGLTKA